MFFSKEQKLAIESKSKKILVIAGAGSGKTKVLTERIKRLIKEEKVPAHNIVAITFTNLAAEEMKERLKSVEGIGDAFIGTIHSFANKIYKTSGVNYKLLVPEVEQKIYHEVLSKRENKEKLSFRKWMSFKDLKQKVEQGKESEFRLRDFLKPSETNFLFNVVKKEVKRIYKRDNIIDFEELLKHALEYFKKIGAKLEHLFVDEVQDIGNLEYEFIKTLNAENYFLVGDDFQSLYAFKGGNVNIFKTLAKDKEFDNYYLTKNFRCSKKIIDLGTKIISQLGTQVIHKEIVPHRSNEGFIKVHSKGDFETLLNLLSKNYKDWFLLTRTNKEAYDLCNVLGMIPHIFIRKADYSLSEIKTLLSMDKVKILTVHSSKGLESKKVILYGNFPIYAPNYIRNVDERKVMYVGITRAEDELHIFN